MVNMILTLKLYISTTKKLDNLTVIRLNLKSEVLLIENIFSTKIIVRLTDSKRMTIGTINVNM
jgi:hypothetical protein